MSPISKIKDFLPAHLRLALEKLDSDTALKISEIRLRADSVSTVTVLGENLYLCNSGLSKQPAGCLKTTKNDLNNFIYGFCGGSVYSYEESLACGYVSRRGIRAGICGNAVIKNGNLSGFSEITGINIRLPVHVSGCSEKITGLIGRKGLENGKGILIASGPGVGKTTMLRDIAINLSKGIMTENINSRKVYRVSVIDERNEIYIPELFSGCAVDIYSGISKKDGLECAVRVMSPEIIICDEIGSAKEAETINDAHTGGVSVIASVHAATINDIISKPALKKLCDNGVFSHICILERINGTVISKLTDTSKITEIC